VPAWPLRPADSHRPRSNAPRTLEPSSPEQPCQPFSSDGASQGYTRPPRRRSSVGQSTALVKRGSRVRIPPSASLGRAKSGLPLLRSGLTRLQNTYISDHRPCRAGVKVRIAPPARRSALALERSRVEAICVSGHEVLTLNEGVAGSSPAVGFALRRGCGAGASSVLLAAGSVLGALRPDAVPG
jgi:hypothetical protein